MPRIPVFVACNEAIIDEQRQNLSVISVIEKVTAMTSGTSKLPPDAAAAMQWSAIAQFQRLPEDEGKEFEFRVDLITPSKTSALSFTGLFDISRPNHRVVLNVTGFPIGELGTYTLTLSLRDRSVGRDWNNWKKRAEYDILLQHTDERSAEPARLAITSE